MHCEDYAVVHHITKQAMKVTSCYGK